MASESSDEKVLLASVGFSRMEFLDEIEEALSDAGIACDWTDSMTGVIGLKVPRDQTEDARRVVLTDARFRGKCFVFYDDRTGEPFRPPQQVPHWSENDKWREDLELVARVPSGDSELFCLVWNVLCDHDIPSDDKDGECSQVHVPRESAEAARQVLRSDPELAGRKIAVVERARGDGE